MPESQANDVKREKSEEPPFGSNLLRLSGRQWLAAGVILAALLWLLPACWTLIEPLETGPDYRLPFSLGNDYWTYRRYCRQACEGDDVIVLGDSVVWGHYVRPKETLTHYLTELSPPDARFANLSINGLHPATMAGLVQHYARPIAGKKVVVHFNFLWLTSPRRDLTAIKEFAFRHPRLAPQFVPWIPCYKETVSERLGAVFARHVPALDWARHLRVAYFNSRSIPAWTFEHPDRNPVGAVTLQLPPPDELPDPAPDARPWREQGIEPFAPEWVALDDSFQWAMFQRTLRILQQRGNQIFVIVGPFNEHLLKEEGRQTHQSMLRQATTWLEAEGIPYAAPPTLPSDLYADPSHPLAKGYERLARQVLEDESFRDFLEK